MGHKLGRPGVEIEKTSASRGSTGPNGQFDGFMMESMDDFQEVSGVVHQLIVHTSGSYEHNWCATTS